MSAGRYIRKRPVAQSISEDEAVEDPSGNIDDPLGHCSSSSLSEPSTLSSLSYEQQLSSSSLKSLYDWCVYQIFLGFRFYFFISF